MKRLKKRRPRGRPQLSGNWRRKREAAVSKHYSLASPGGGAPGGDPAGGGPPAGGGFIAPEARRARASWRKAVHPGESSARWALKQRLASGPLSPGQRLRTSAPQATRMLGPCPGGGAAVWALAVCATQIAAPMRANLIERCFMSCPCSSPK